jgi:hypothetical protein
MAKKQYEHLVLDKLIAQGPPVEPMNSAYLVGNPDFWKKIDADGGAVGQFAFYYVMRAGMFMEPPHTHKNQEYLMFISSDPKDMKNLGATVEVAFGEEWEKYSFNYSTFVHFPKGVVHCPIFVRNLQRPFFLGHFWPGGEAAHFDNLK